MNPIVTLSVTHPTKDQIGGPSWRSEIQPPVPLATKYKAIVTDVSVSVHHPPFKRTFPHPASITREPHNHIRRNPHKFGRRGIWEKITAFYGPDSFTREVWSGKSQRHGDLDLSSPTQKSPYALKPLPCSTLFVEVAPAGDPRPRT